MMTHALTRALSVLTLLVAGVGDCARLVLDSNQQGSAPAPAPLPQYPMNPGQGSPGATPGWQPQPPVHPAPAAPAGTRRLPLGSADEIAGVNRTLDLIEQGGPFPYRQDGVVFTNREGRLPPRPYGYYHEYTVPTPGAPTRGTRRIIRGAGGETYYTNDHYGSFVPIDPTRY